MLYVSTREKYDAFTAHRTLTEDRTPDGGVYLPYRMPCFSTDEIRALKGKSFGQCAAEILNQFFAARLSAWDVEFCVGRYPVKIAAMSHRILIGETWRNLDGSYEKMECRLAAKICGCDAAEVKITSWLRIAIRIAVLFGVFSELMRSEAYDCGQRIDVAVNAGDFSLPMALWYGREMGLPIAAIICSCGETSGVWDLLHLGEFRGSKAASELERLVYGTLGISEAKRFGQICEKGGEFTLLPAAAETLRSGMFAAVISRDRMSSVIPSVYRTNAYILDPDAAYGYGGLMDYRAKTGESKTALLLADSNPADQANTVAAAMQITAEELKRLLEKA